VAGTSYVSMTPIEIERYLHGLTERLADALRAPSFTALPGYEVGTSLVNADLDSPEGLGRTVGVIHDHLLSDLGLVGDEPRRRLSTLLEALVSGYTRALRDRTLDEQEAVRRATLAARERAEQALRASEARFRHQATHDPLTGLPNRALFTERLVQILANPPPGMRLGVCFVDLDGFKNINDSFGHHVGDRLLAAVSDRLSTLTTGSGHLVARLGGDEFVILVEDTSGTDDAVKVADQALVILSEPVPVDGHQITISASIGVVERLVADTEPTDLMRAADITLYQAKANGRARWELFDPDHSTREIARYKLAAAMPAALDRDQFTLYYQPLVDLADGTVQGVEALARWRHPHLGLLTPDRFIDLAEDSGLIVPLGSRLLEQACEQGVRWHRLTSTAPLVSVNLSARQIRRPGLVANVAAILDRSGLPPPKLQLEITESAMLGTDDGTIHTVQALADLGVRLAIDDFGTGYSSLGYLHALPVHGLKLASTFVRGLRSPAAVVSTDEAILTTLVSLAHTLGLTVTAEGIETDAQARQVRAIGCDIGQGWHFGRPQPPWHITNLITGVHRQSRPPRDGVTDDPIDRARRPTNG
jgi:diguanylate cyclase (GGDEF)-like protein